MIFEFGILKHRAESLEFGIWIAEVGMLKQRAKRIE
jgi:hypothetical protein